MFSSKHLLLVLSVKRDFKKLILKFDVSKYRKINEKKSFERMQDVDLERLERSRTKIKREASQVEMINLC